MVASFGEELARELVAYAAVCCVVLIKRTEALDWCE